MNHIILFFNIILLPVICIWNPMTLDISNVSDEFYVSNDIHDNITYTSIRALPTYRIVKVVDGNQVIWSEEYELYPLSSILLHYKDNEFNLMFISTKFGYDKHSFCFCKNENNIWCRITIEDYLKKEKELMYNLVLDLGKSPNNLHQETIITSFGNSKRYYSPFLPKNITEIREGDQLIWSNDSIDEYTRLVILVSRRDEHKLLEFILRKGSMTKDIYYLEKENGTWKMITEDAHYKKLMKIENEMILDISDTNSINTSKYDINVDISNGLPTVIYISKRKTYTTEVKDNDILVWESDGYLKCAYAIVNLKDYNPILVQLQIENETSHGKLYFNKSNGIWNTLERNEFYKLLQEYDDEINRIM